MRDRLLASRIRAGTKGVLLLGPRQVGKSTICRALGADLYIDLADERQFLDHAKIPGLLRGMVEALDEPGLVIIDEVQRVPSLLNSVQSIADRGSRRFVLTGFSVRKLRRGGANLLPGRVVLEKLDPLSVLELPQPLDLDRALQVGMLPGI